MTLLFLSEPSGRASHLSSTAEQNNFMCLQSLYWLRKADKNQFSREGKKAASSQLQAEEVPHFRQTGVEVMGRDKPQKPTPLRTGWAGCTTPWTIWSHTGFATFRKWYSTIRHPCLGTFGQTASKARAFHSTPLCLHSQWHKCIPDRNWGQNKPSWLTPSPLLPKHREETNWNPDVKG